MSEHQRTPREKKAHEQRPTTSIWTLAQVRDSIAEELDFANPNRPDYCTDVEVEHLLRWQESVAAAEARESALLEACKELLRTVDDGWIPPDDLAPNEEAAWNNACHQFKISGAAGAARAAIAAAEGREVSP